ncbi:type II toxin-antitoxin system RelE/ParE family toxin [Microcoleus sp. LEGE 07076]|uniref:type II toxin-antitoxin system RelE/ParE family toxin n=1 Tax=Microcoleus sp. LEGE 07076 TaxID=915322 RepID=UPI0018818932|nr:type II toxin-antitoxin system RelE/ParE family toxin [Microcoleus sp. LEGE 07076]MBE9183280.1 type II toxin-antitoxin system RelE/ParE family toxin [Microcoleus sp. LEGE 07076]
MTWNIEFHSDFHSEFTEFPTDVRLELLAKLTLLQEFGPNLKRPHVDTLNGSTYTNRSELRFQAADGVWRVAFAFDPHRFAILLVAGDKSGGSEKRFYKQLIKIADSRFADHLTKLMEQERDDN